MQKFDTVKYLIPIKSQWIFSRSGIIIIIIIIIMISSITVFAGALFVHQLGTNHAHRASVTQVNHSVHTLSTSLRIRSDPSMQILLLLLLLLSLYHYH